MVAMCSFCRHQRGIVKGFALFRVRSLRADRDAYEV